MCTHETRSKYTQIHLWDLWQNNIPPPQTLHSTAFLTPRLSLLRSSRCWLTSHCSLRAPAPVGWRESKNKNTQTNDKFMTDQTSVYSSGQGQRGEKKAQ